MPTEVKVVEDSISEEGIRLTTLQMKFHRFILPEFNTHRVFSRNFSSSRAIPTAKLLDQVRNDPATPVHWGKNQPGMQAFEELTGKDLEDAQDAWTRAANFAANVAEEMNASGAHKQIVNRIIEPYLWVNGIVSSTEWSNWDELRAHPDAQPEIKHLAELMIEARNKSVPTLLNPGEWHLPYVTKEERASTDIDLLKKISAARCCRVSYLKHDGTASDIQEDLILCDRLAASRPIHASPFEHQATPDKLVTMVATSNSYWLQEQLHGNFTGWVQHRKQIEQSFR